MVIAAQIEDGHLSGPHDLFRGAEWIGKRLSEVETELHAAEDTLKEFRERNRRVIDSPELLLQQARLERGVTLKSTIFLELKKQYELAKIEEIKKVSIVSVLDHGRVPVKKERPRRARNSAIAFLVTLLSLSLYSGLKPRYAERVRGFVQRLRVARRIESRIGKEHSES